MRSTVASQSSTARPLLRETQRVAVVHVLEPLLRAGERFESAGPGLRPARSIGVPDELLNVLSVAADQREFVLLVLHVPGVASAAIDRLAEVRDRPSCLELLLDEAAAFLVELRAGSLVYGPLPVFEGLEGEIRRLCFWRGAQRQHLTGRRFIRRQGFCFFFRASLHHCITASLVPQDRGRHGGWRWWRGRVPQDRGRHGGWRWWRGRVPQDRGRHGGWRWWRRGRLGDHAGTARQRIEGLRELEAGVGHPYAQLAADLRSELALRPPLEDRPPRRAANGGGVRRLGFGAA